jgi:hypothetical protein
MIVAGIGTEGAFYEVAATLIPLFLLAGIVIDRVRPRENDSPRRLLVFLMVIPVVGLFAFFAEVSAIRSIVIGPNTKSRILVEGFLAFAITAAILSAWLPWGAAFWRRYLMPRGWLPVIGVLVVGLVFVLLGTKAFDTAVTSESAASTTNAINEEINARIRMQTDVEGRKRSLEAQGARVRQELREAVAHREVCAVLNGLVEEEETLISLVNLEKDVEYELILEGNNLYREREGKPPRSQLPSAVFPKVKKPPHTRVSGCAKHRT